MRVSERVLGLLSRCEADGAKLYIPERLERDEYLAVAKVIEAAGGKWTRKAKTHVFPGVAIEAIDPILLTGEVVDRKRALGQFFTPADVAEKVIAKAGLAPGMRLLEPSAGVGNLAVPMLATSPRELRCIEIDGLNATRLIAALHVVPRQRLPVTCTVDTGDFLHVRPRLGDLYDAAVMNPPFAKQADIDHVLHAWKFLQSGGRLVSIMSSGIKFRQDRYATSFRAFLRNAVDDGAIDDLPVDSFKESGTGVNAVLVSFTVR